MSPTPIHHGHPPRPEKASRRLAGRVRHWMQWLAEPQGDPQEGPGGGEYRLPRWFLVFLALFGGGMILISLIGDQGLIAYYQLRGEAARLRSDVSALSERKSRLSRKIEALRGNPEYIEHLARQKLGLVKPGEVVLQLPRGGRAP